MLDFSHKNFSELLKKLLESKYSFETFFQHCTFDNSSEKVILRHDVDRIPLNSVKTARIEYSLGIKGTYYFRVVTKSYDLNIMATIAELGHEIGYHYEDVDLVLSNNKELRTKDQGQIIDAAFESFCKNLELFRQNFDIKTICMHGSPLAKYDNKIIWQKYNYRDLGIIGEPYLDLNFNEFAYLTDTGRKWNGDKFSLRDKVKSKYNFNFKSTQDIIDGIDRLPDKVMFTIHPQRWHDNPLLWLKELLFQNVKNQIKRIIVARK
jgi:hypothetical protein